MKKEKFLRNIAETAYNVGFGAKKHFATYDISLKAPGLISFTSFAFGIFALIFNDLNIKAISATFLVLGISGIYISMYESRRAEYAHNGKVLTDLFNDLKRLYYEASESGSISEEFKDELKRIDKEYTNISCPHQMIFSNWYAHYKFFWEQQIDWIDEQLKFSFLRDRIPLSFSLTLMTSVVVMLLYSSPLTKYLCANLLK